MNPTIWIAAPLVFVSGCCALIYQVVWTRELRFVFGASTAASSAVIAIFIAGLGFGGLWFGRRAERHAQPLALYARLEFGIALVSACSPLLLALVRTLYVWSGGSLRLGMAGSSAVRLLLATLVLGPATWLMGGTLPALARAVEDEADRARSRVAWLYGLNTLGAVVGTSLSTFLLLEQLGSRATLFSAAGLNVLVAAAAWLMSQRVQSVATGSGSPQPSAAGEASQAALAPPPWIFASAAIVGFGFFLMELVWYRMLTPLLGGTIFTFGLILAVALAGIGAGSALYAMVLSRQRWGLSAFALSCALEALCLALPFALGDRIAAWALLLRPLGALGFSGFLSGWAVISIIVVFPAAFVSGLQFPMLISLLGAGREHVARDVGAAYAANTLGAVCGAIAGGFGLLPALGALGCWRLVCGLLAGWAALIAVMALVRGLVRFHAAWSFALTGLTVALILTEGPTAAWRHSPIGAGRLSTQGLDSPNAVRRVLNDQRRGIDWQTDGIENSLAIHHYDAVGFLVNGKSDGNAIGDAPTQVMGGLVGAALVPRVQRAMVIGLGTGSTAGWLARLPELQQVDVAEIEPAMLTVAKRCELVNEFALDNPKLKVHRGDARELLAVSRQRYDLIFSEPSNPYRAGVASLYTREFYLAVQERLAPGGVFVQWLQGYDVDRDTLRSVYATLGSVYPHIETFFGEQADLLLVASKHAPVHDVAALRARIAQEPFIRALRITWQTDSLEGFFSHYLANPEFARSAARSGAAINTDDRSPVEFGFARSLKGSLYSVRDFFTLAKRAAQNRPSLRNGAVDWDHSDFEHESFPIMSGGLPPNGELTPSYKKRFEVLVHWSAGDFPGALALWNALDEQVRPTAPTLIERLVLSELLAYLGEDYTEPWVTSMIPEQPTLSLALRAVWLARHGKGKEATDVLAQSLHQYRVDPWPPAMQMARAFRLMRVGSAADRPLALIWVEALSEPFAVYANETARERALLDISAGLGTTDPTCVTVLERLEPNPEWNETLLEFRANCYEQQKHPLRDRAHAELALFRKTAG